jgi:hypothetical protein
LLVEEPESYELHVDCEEQTDEFKTKLRIRKKWARE